MLLRLSPLGGIIQKNWIDVASVSSHLLHLINHIWIRGSCCVWGGVVQSILPQKNNNKIQRLEDSRIHINGYQAVFPYTSTSSHHLCTGRMADGGKYSNWGWQGARKGDRGAKRKLMPATEQTEKQKTHSNRRTCKLLSQKSSGVFFTQNFLAVWEPIE